MKNPKSILITGGSSGLGEALCLSYAAPGIHITFNGRDKTRVNDLATRLKKSSATVDGRVLDVTDRDAMKDWIFETDDRHPLDLVIANAGVGTPRGEIENMDESTRYVFDVNLYGVFNTVHPSLIRMAGRGRGQIAMVSSIAGYMGLGNTPAYSASKVAVKAYGRALRTHYMNSGMEISVICPGWILTRMTEPFKEKVPIWTSMDWAVRFIRSGLERNRGLISFPPSLRFLIWWMLSWPDYVIDRIHPRVMKSGRMRR